jgi:epoxyqueuosine reductase
MTLAAAVKRRADELGFLACGITDPSPIADGGRLDQWLASGYAGVMRYLHRQARKRKDPRLIIPEAKSVVVVLDNYYDGAADPGPAPRVARYARGEDYHRVTRARMEPLADYLRSRGATVAHTFADSGPVPERALALRAGLGWIGKNTMLIRPGAGSFFFIGTIFTDLPLDHDDSVSTDHCGHCTRCLDACPTAALIEPGLLDATRCISYLTIEQKGPIPSPLAEQLDGWVFGCDICNEVCPWNQRFAEASSTDEFRSRDALAGAAPDFFEQMDEEGFTRRFGDTPLERAGLRGMRRNFRAALSHEPRAARREPEPR